jgi:hypothetical protein
MTCGTSEGNIQKQMSAFDPFGNPGSRCEKGHQHTKVQLLLWLLLFPRRFRGIILFPPRHHARHRRRNLYVITVSNLSLYFLSHPMSELPNVFRLTKFGSTHLWQIFSSRSLAWCTGGEKTKMLHLKMRYRPFNPTTLSRPAVFRFTVEEGE